MLRTQVARRLNAPARLVGRAALRRRRSLLGLRDVAEYEAQAAIDLEIAAGERAAVPLPSRLARVDGLLVYDPRPTLRALLEGVADGRPAGVLAAAFHETIAEVTRELVRRRPGRDRARASSACRAASSRTAASRRRCCGGSAGDGFDVFINRRVPVNDGGISYGQAAVAAARMAAAGTAGADVPVRRA